jgi:cytochrome c oxidase assembly protein subunit 11
MTSRPTSSAKASVGARRTAAACIAGAVGMLGLAYASVPLYDLFCRVTGFDGTPLVGTGPSKTVLDKTVAVRFDTNVAPGLNWSFAPEATHVAAKLGETKTVFFRVRNEGPSPSTGIATFNIQPGVAGGYFVKIQCFCFNEQTLQPGEVMDFPVVFYLDPALTEDGNTKDLAEITLSYTYFASKAGKATAAAAPVSDAANRKL